MGEERSPKPTVTKEAECGWGLGTYYESKGYQVSVETASDHELYSAIMGEYGQGPETAKDAAVEWLVRHPQGVYGAKRWAREAIAKVKTFGLPTPAMKTVSYYTSREAWEAGSPPVHSVALSEEMARRQVALAPTFSYTKFAVMVDHVRPYADSQE